ncbi:hypothetical protein [Desulfohalobium retbaense]|uniref:Lipoprotein n=1 Tax=Desulfohalobium retbaense (strain ATCC 49708 / DSM 5692 / JCM 16813 / HR100) TaxID=485915 RepID=C8X1N2_DESRD|nr:hypothetical protein [Desulfohalobium retbaense]ACV68454.1 hypothetical protein Dret_1166 [Desulfohalobium retbaense DSM 5692]
MSTKTIACLAMLALLISASLGCSGGNLPQSKRFTYTIDNMGISQESAKYHQTYDPYAGKSPEKVEGHEGKKAIISSDNYRKTYTETKDPDEEVSSDFDISSGMD